MCRVTTLHTLTEIVRYSSVTNEEDSVNTTLIILTLYYGATAVVSRQSSSAIDQESSSDRLRVVTSRGQESSYFKMVTT